MDTNKEEMAIEESPDNLKKKLERVIRLRHVHFLDTFLDDTQNNNNLIEEILVEVEQDFATKHINLLPPVQEAVESRIIQFRLHSEQVQSKDDRTENISLDDVRHCVEMIERNVTKICVDYSEREVDSVFLHIATPIARYIHVLKRFLKPTFSLLPWNEIEFCLVIFLSTILKPQSSDEIYLLILNKIIILKHLEVFSKKLSEVSRTLQKKDITSKGRLSGRIDSVKKIIAEHPEFQDLYNDYDIVKDVYSLNRILSYVKMAISVDIQDDSELGKAIIGRTLQVLGECLKNTPDSPNVSDDVHRLLINSAPRHAKDITTSLRDFLSHADTLTKKIELESEKDSEFFVFVQNDLKKMGAEVTCILNRKKIDALKGLKNKIVRCNSLEQIKNLFDGFKNSSSLDENCLPFRKMELVKIKEFHAEFEMLYAGHSLKRDTVIKEIKEIIDLEESKIEQVTESYKHHFRELNHILKYSYNIKSLKVRTMNLFRNITLNETKLNEIVPMIKENFVKKGISTNATIANFKILFSISYENDRVPGIDEIKDLLSKNKNKENDNIKKQIFEIFDIIVSKLGTKDEKDEFTKMIDGKVKLHESKNKLINYFNTKLLSTAIVQVNDINCLSLFNDLNLEGKKKQDLEKNYNDRNFEKCRLLVKQVDDKYNSLLTSMRKISKFSVEKFVIALKAFFSSDKTLRQQINQAIEKIGEEKKLKVAKFYLKRLTVLKNILENGKCEKDNEIAIEMLILEATEMLEHASLLADSKFFLVEDSPVLVGKSLRNYLAHGDPLIDVMQFNPRTSIITHARALVAQGGDLITQGRVLGRSSKPVDFLEVHSRDSRKEMMAAAQEGMFQAAKKGDLVEVQEWMSKGADPQGRSINGKSALHFAIISDDVDTFQFFLEQGITLDIRQTLVDAVSEGSKNILKYVCDTYSLDLNTKYFKDAYLIHCVSKSGKTRVLEYLLSRIRDPDTLDEKGNHPLAYAVKEGHKEIVEILLRHTTYMNNPEGYLDIIKIGVVYGHSNIVSIILNHAYESNLEIYTKSPLLHYAAAFGHVTAIPVLLDIGFSVNDLNEDDETPLLLAIKNGCEDFALMLLDNRAEIDTKFYKDFNLLQWAALVGLENVIKPLLDKGFPVNTLSPKGFTALHLAAHYGQLGAVRVLLDSGAGAHVGIGIDGYSSGVSSLHLAASSGYTDVVRELIDKDPKILNTRDTSLEVPLHWAAMAGHVDVVAALVEAGAELNCANMEGGTPLHVSICMEHRNVSKFLIEKGADTGMKTIHGASMLMMACNVACIETVDALIARGADVNDRSMNGNTPLIAAANAGSEKVISALLDAGAQGDNQNDLGETPLIRAIRCTHNNNKMVEKLLAKCPQAVHIPSGDGQTPLEHAIITGYCDVVATLLRHGADVNITSEEAADYLLNAIMCNHKGVVELLLKHGFLVNGSGEEGNCPLQCAVTHDRRDVARVLLDHGADVNISCDGIPLLTQAMIFRHEDLAILLVERGAKVNVHIHLPGKPSFTPLGQALEHGLFRLSRALILHGADIWDVCDGDSALHFAVRSVHCDVDMIHFILDQEEERLWSSSQGDGSSQVLQKNKALVNCRDSEGRTPLHLSCIRGRADVLIALLDRGADPALMNNGGSTALHCAAICGHAEIIHMMIDREVCSISVRDKKGRSALHLGCETGSAEVVRALLNNGALVNAKDNDLTTPLHVAAYCGHAHITRILIDRKASPNPQEKLDRTPLFLACANGHEDVVKILLEIGADVNIAAFGLKTATHMAASEGHSKIITLLLEKEADVDPRDANDWTPMFCAAESGHPGIIQLLAANGASVNAVATKGMTPLLVAARSEKAPEAKSATVEALLEAGADPNLHASNSLTPLWFAVLKADISLVSVLLQGGANVNIVDEKGVTPFMFAQNKFFNERDEEVRRKYELIAGLLLSASE